MRETWHVCSYGKIGTRIRIGYGYQKVISAHLWYGPQSPSWVYRGTTAPPFVSSVYSSLQYFNARRRVSSVARSCSCLCLSICHKPVLTASNSLIITITTSSFTYLLIYLDDHGASCDHCQQADCWKRWVLTVELEPYT